MDEVLRKIEQCQELRNFLESRTPVEDGPGCLNCKLTLEDLLANGRLTGYPLDSLGGGTYPAQGKILHLANELGVERMIDGIKIRGVKDLLPDIHSKLELLGTEATNHVDEEW